jgi:NAD-specific glutamate dehydrogenase
MRALPGLAALLLCLACGGATNTERAAESQRRIQDWLLCEECTEGEFAAVVTLGAEAVPSLAATLRGGLSPASRARLEEQLGEVWERGAPAHLARDEFIAHHVGNRDALLRVRSARALGRIRTPEALAALREALSLRQRPSVEESIRAALEEPAAGG